MFFGAPKGMTTADNFTKPTVSRRYRRHKRRNPHSLNTRAAVAGSSDDDQRLVAPGAGSRTNGRIHVTLDFTRGEGTVIETYFIDPSPEKFPPDAIAADAERIVCGGNGPRQGAVSDRNPIDIQP